MKFSNRKLFLGLGLISLVFFVQLLGQTNEQIVEANEDRLIKNNSAVTLETAALPLKVSGIVKASDRAIVSAKTSGVVTDLYFKEGSYVAAGQVLARQHTPVLDAQIALRNAETSLTSVEQAAAVDRAEAASNKAIVVSLSAKEMADLSAVSSDHRVSEATAGLIVTTQSSVNVLLEALQFVDTNRGLFRGEDLKNYNELVNKIYGSMPKHFQGGVMYSVESSEDVLDLLNTLKEQDTVDTLTALNLGVLIDADLQALGDIFSGAEADVLDESRVATDSSTYEQYFAYRTAIVEALGGLTTSVATVQGAADSALSNATTQERTVAVSDIDAESAVSQATFSEAIAQSAKEVRVLATDVAIAEQQLGVVTSPFAGVVVKRFKEQGEYAVPGEPLLQLSGTGGAEVAVSVPVEFVALLESGQEFVVNGNTVGVVDRYSSVSEGNSVIVVLALSEQVVNMGQSITGEIMLEPKENIYQLSRSYIHFSSNGAYVLDEQGKEYEIDIIYDAGDIVYLKVSSLPDVALKPAYSIFLAS